jgi:XTP/dITP diphosphohydrolase
MKIVLATRNRKKLDELRRILSDMKDVEIVGLDSFPKCPEVDETGSTFEENSWLKAEAAAKCTGLWAVADDSGLEVDALGGAPGVYSSRYAGEDGNDRKNIEKLLSELKNVPREKRTARFRTVVTLASPEGRIRYFEGSVEGIIGTEPEGEGGFGYDPVFFPESHIRTFAHMPPEEKDALSHRARALKKLKNFLLESRGSAL